MTRKHSSFMAEIAAAKKDASELRKVMGDSARTATLSFPASRREAPVASGIPKWVDDPHDIEQGQMLNPAWLKFHNLTPSEALSPATVAQPVAWMSPDGDVMSEERKRFWIKGDGGYRAQAKKFTRPLYGAQPYASQGCGGAVSEQEAPQLLDFRCTYCGSPPGVSCTGTLSVAHAQRLEALRAALSTDKSGGADHA